MLLLSAVGFCIWPYQSLLPWFADQVYGGSSQTLGVLIGTGGLGAVSALLFLASRPTIRGLLRMIAAAAALSGLALAAFGLCQLLWVGLVSGLPGRRGTDVRRGLDQHRAAEHRAGRTARARRLALRDVVSRRRAARRPRRRLGRRAHRSAADARRWRPARHRCGRRSTFASCPRSGATSCRSTSSSASSAARDAQ